MSSYEKADSLYDLPIINWSKVDATAPEPIAFDHEGSYETLPTADVVVITWTSAEWSALDHVFVHSQNYRSPTDDAWRSDWREFKPSGASEALGYFCRVNITTASGETKVVMPFKSSCHLSQPNFITGVTDMVNHIIAQAKPNKLFSIGTSGGATLQDFLGDVAVTNSAKIQLELAANEASPCNGTTVQSNWFPDTSMMSSVQDKLFIPLSEVLTYSEWSSLLKTFHDKVKDSSEYTLKELINGPLKHENISTPTVKLSPHTPLFTTDYYYISGGEGNDAYCALEMDDGIVGYVAGLQNVDYVFVRNISDTVVIGEVTIGGEAQNVPKKIRQGWSGVIYNKCGFYTSFNGALTAWAAIRTL